MFCNFFCENQTALPVDDEEGGKLAKAVHEPVTALGKDQFMELVLKASSDGKPYKLEVPVQVLAVPN